MKFHSGLASTASATELKKQTRVSHYLDFNATGALGSAVADTLIQFIQEAAARPLPVIGNPSSIHQWGRRSRKWLNDAREAVALSLQDQINSVDPEQIIFTSSGTEANQLAIVSGLKRAKRWILSSIEHDSVLQMQTWAKEQGKEVIIISVDDQGEPRWDELEKILKESEQNHIPTLLSWILVNNETGIILDLNRLNKLTFDFRKKKLLEVHLDAAQAWGKIPLVAETLPADWLSLSGHKISGVAGVGVLWIRPGRPVVSILTGKQERGRRGGTENLLGIVALGAAAKRLSMYSGDIEAYWSSTKELRAWFEATLISKIPDVSVHGAKANRVAGTSNISLPEVEGEGLLLALDLEGFGLSAGSACSSGALEPSHVLLAMGKSPKEALSSLRVSLSPETTKEALQELIVVLESTLQKVANTKGTSSQ